MSLVTFLKLLHRMYASDLGFFSLLLKLIRGKKASTKRHYDCTTW